MGNARAAILCRVSPKTAASDSNPTPLEPGRCRNSQYSVLPEPAKRSTTCARALGGRGLAIAATSLPIASPNRSRVHSTAATNHHQDSTLANVLTHNRATEDSDYSHFLLAALLMSVARLFCISVVGETDDRGNPSPSLF
jgi:hypothetical protein